MWVGFSKSIAGGFRVGIGTRIGGKQKKGPSQRDIAKLEKVQFLAKVAEDANELLDQFMVNHNIDPQTAKKKNLNLEDFFTEANVKSEFELFVTTIKEIKDIIGKVEYGGNLTAQRKDKLVDRIMTMREIVSRTGPGLNALAEVISDKYAALGRTIALSIFGFIAVLSALGLFFDKSATTDLAGSLTFALVAAVIVSALVYLPIYFILKFAAWAAYRRGAVIKMKEVHGIS